MQQPDESAPRDEADRVEDSILHTLIGYRMKRAYMQIQPVAQNALVQHELRLVSFSCLSIITDNPGIVQSELAAVLQMERSNIVVIIDELEERGLITRKKVPTDRRRYALTTTLRGRQLRDRAAKTLTQAEDDLFGRLTPQDRNHLLTVLRNLERQKGG